MTPIGTPDPLVGSFFQGICTASTDKTHDHVCVGSSTGSLHVFKCSPVFQIIEVCKLIWLQNPQGSRAPPHLPHDPTWRTTTYSKRRWRQSVALGHQFSRYNTLLVLEAAKNASSAAQQMV